MYLLTQILVYLALAAVTGFLCGWWFGRCRCNEAALRAEHAKAEAKWTAEARDLRAKLAAAPIAADHGKMTQDWQTKLAAAEAAHAEAVAKAAAASTAQNARIAALEADLAAAKVAAATAPPPPPSSTPLGLMGAMGAAALVSNAAFTPSSAATMSAADLEAAVLAAGAGERPVALAQSQGAPDDLKEIGGVGPAIEDWLHRTGIFHFWQIATMQPRHLAWLANNLPHFGMRVYRENWVDQAVRLARGEETDAKKKYQEGKHT